MSDPTETQPLEPLDFDVDINDADTSMPVLAQGLYDLRIESIGKERNKRDDGFNAIVTFRTVDVAVSTRAKEINPGYPLKVWYPLQSHDKDTGEPTAKWKENLAQLIDAALDTEQGNRPNLSAAAAQLPGKVVRARIKVEDDDNGIPRNRVGRFVKE